MENIGKDLIGGQADVELNRSLLKKNQAEADKYAAEKRHIELQAALLKRTFWLRPIIAGIALALAAIPVLKLIILPAMDIQAKNNELQQLDLQLQLRRLNDSVRHREELLNQMDEQIQAISNAYLQRSSRLRELEGFGTMKANKRILFIDDRPNTDNKLIINYLENSGFLVDEVVNTNTALDSLKGYPNKYQFIISDMGRLENRQYLYNAGELFYERFLELKVPATVIFFTYTNNQKLLERIQNQIKKAGRKDAVTNSSSVVLELLQGSQVAL